MTAALVEFASLGFPGCSDTRVCSPAAPYHESSGGGGNLAYPTAPPKHWIATIPEPATLPLRAFGALVLLRRRGGLCKCRPEAEPCPA